MPIYTLKNSVDQLETNCVMLQQFYLYNLLLFRKYKQDHMITRFKKYPNPKIKKENAKMWHMSLMKISLRKYFSQQIMYVAILLERVHELMLISKVLFVIVC